jgi:hypothetical protein
MVNLLDITKKSEPLKKPLAELKQHDWNLQKKTKL